jgi:hypothetical protein
VLGGPEGIVIAIGTGENYDAEFHRKPPSHYTVTMLVAQFGKNRHVDAPR